MKPSWIWFEIKPFGVWEFGFGAHFGWTWLSNAVFQAIVLFGWFYFVESWIVGATNVFTCWLLLELHSAWQYHYDRGNFFDFFEFGTAVLWTIAGLAQL